MQGPYAMLSTAEIKAVMAALPTSVENPPPELITAIDKMGGALSYDADAGLRRAFREPMA